MIIKDDDEKNIFSFDSGRTLPDFLLEGWRISDRGTDAESILLNIRFNILVEPIFLNLTFQQKE